MASDVEEIPIDRIEASYDERGLDAVSDHDLVAAVAAVVAEPREGPANSFVLHAPLELTARARLLAQTPTESRRLARLRILSIAARFQAEEPADLDPSPATDNGTGTGTGTGTGDTGTGDTANAVIAAIDRGDMVGVDAAVRALATTTADLGPIVGSLATTIADRSAAAAHGPIFLATLVEAPDNARAWLPLLRPLARELARRPEGRLSWIDRVAAETGPGTANPEAASPGTGASGDADALFAVLADPPRLGVPGSSFIHPLLMQVDAEGVADTLLGPVAGPGRPADRAAARAITRVAALSMVRDNPAHAPYGWTHSLTLPQAILTLAPLIEAGGGHPLAIAATQVLAFRVAQGSVTLDPTDPLLRPADRGTEAKRREELVVQAAKRHDAHIAKYLLASLTAADTDPEAGELHLSAAEHLLATWDDLGPDPDDILG